MNVLLLTTSLFDLTEVKLFIQSLPTGSTLLLSGKSDSFAPIRHLADRMRVPIRIVDKHIDLDDVSFVRSLFWQLDTKRVTSWLNLTSKAASQGKLLKKNFPSRLCENKTFVYCPKCHTMHSEGYSLDEIEHCQSCCAPKQSLLQISGRGKAFINFQAKTQYKTLTPEGRKAWPYNESKEEYLYRDSREWFTCTERIRRAYREGETKAHKTTFTL
jgi:hypothetical protein